MKSRGDNLKASQELGYSRNISDQVKLQKDSNRSTQARQHRSSSPYRHRRTSRPSPSANTRTRRRRRCTRTTHTRSLSRTQLLLSRSNDELIRANILSLDRTQRIRPPTRRNKAGITTPTRKASCIRPEDSCPHDSLHASGVCQATTV